LLNLVSIERQVEESHPQLLVGSAFGCFRRLAELPPACLLPVLSHPVSVRWSAEAKMLLDRREAESLRAHLDSFAPLAISCFAACGHDFALEEACLPREFSFPGLGLALKHGEARRLRLAVTARSDGVVIELGHGDAVTLIASDVASGDLPRSDVGGLEVFRFPRCYGQRIFFEYAEPVLRRIFPRVADEGEVDVTLWLSRLGDSARLLRRYWPGMYDELSASVLVIVPTSAGPSEHQSTGSDSTAGGAVSTTLVSEPWFTDGIIHEHRHDLLNSLSLLDDILDAGAPGVATFYSPWRPEPRPAVGLLHAVFVFVAVAEFYTRLLTAGGGGLDLTAEEIAEALGLQVINLCNGLEELKAGASFSPFGRELLSSLNDEAARLHGEAVRLGAFSSGGAERKASAHYQAWASTWGRHAVTQVRRNIQRWAR
jgi:HEXXH motif-containing protein